MFHSMRDHETRRLLNGYQKRVRGRQEDTKLRAAPSASLLYSGDMASKLMQVLFPQPIDARTTSYTAHGHLASCVAQPNSLKKQPQAKKHILSSSQHGIKAKQRTVSMDCRAENEGLCLQLHGSKTVLMRFPKHPPTPASMTTTVLELSDRH